MLAVCVETQATGLNDTKIFIIPAASNRFLLTQRKSVDESRVKGRRWNKKKKKTRSSRIQPSKHEQRDLAKQLVRVSIFDTRSPDRNRSGIDRPIDRRTNSVIDSWIAVNEGFTVDFRKIDSKRARCLLPSPSRPSLFVSLPLVHPRAAQRRNRPPAKRECISRLLSFPSISYRKEKEYSTRILAYVSTVSSRCSRRLWLTRAATLTCTTRLQDLQLITDFIAPSHDRVAVSTRNLGPVRRDNRRTTRFLCDFVVISLQCHSNCDFVPARSRCSPALCFQ